MCTKSLNCNNNSIFAVKFQIYSVFYVLLCKITSFLSAFTCYFCFFHSLGIKINVLMLFVSLVNDCGVLVTGLVKMCYMTTFITETYCHFSFVVSLAIDHPSYQVLNKLQKLHSLIKLHLKVFISYRFFLKLNQKLVKLQYTQPIVCIYHKTFFLSWQVITISFYTFN